MSQIEEANKEFEKYIFPKVIWYQENDRLRGLVTQEILDHLWKQMAPGIKSFWNAKMEEAVQEALKGKFFNKVTIDEEVNIPAELMKHIKSQLIQDFRKLVEGRIEENEDAGDGEWAEGYNQCADDILDELKQ